MSKEEALIEALKIIDTCKKYGDICLQCPFNMGGCIVTDGDITPIDWRAGDSIELLRTAKHE